jgi:hypothetical protein
VHEQHKLDEAGHFLGGMTRSAEDPKAFQFELSAFLSSARSVMQFALEEAKTKAGGQAWFDAHAIGNPVLSFFKDKRNVNIHQRPVAAPATINVAVTDAVQISEAVSIRDFDEDGKLVSERGTGSRTPAPLVSPPPSVSRVYNFPDWSGREDVLQLCRNYITALEAVVNDGHSQGFLT